MSNTNYRTLTFTLLTLGILFLGIYVYEVNTAPEPGDEAVANELSLDYVSSLPADSLSQEEIEGLKYMVEEEKLAHDVYVTLYDVWGVQIFDKIKDSETTHIDLVKALLVKYDIEDPSLSNIGEFENQILQDLYDDLIATGSISTLEALKVGALIEEVDIIDLVNYNDQTDNEDILYVYDILLSGSYNHLRAFVNQIGANGETYSPVLMDQVDYDVVLSGGEENGPSQAQQEVIDDSQPNITWLYLGIAAFIFSFVPFYYSSKND